MGKTYWASLIVVVNKKGVICNDFKTTAKAVKLEHCPLPRTEDIFESLAGAKVFTVLDLSRIYQ